MNIIFEKSVNGRKGISLPKLDVPKKENIIPEEYIRQDNNLPELSWSLDP